MHLKVLISSWRWRNKFLDPSNIGDGFVERIFHLPSTSQTLILEVSVLLFQNFHKSEKVSLVNAVYSLKIICYDFRVDSLFERAVLTGKTLMNNLDWGTCVCLWLGTLKYEQPHLHSLSYDKFYIQTLSNLIIIYLILGNAISGICIPFPLKS